MRLGVALAVAAAFASLARDAPVLMGPDGLAPAAPLLARLGETVDDAAWRLPTLFHWVPATDTTLRFLAVAGLLASGALAFRRTAWAAWPLALLYLSFANAGTTFFTFQWDSLIVETLVILPALGRGRVGVWLAWWLLFRLNLQSGLAKLLWSDDWTSLRAMGDYWRTAPLPTPLAWWADRLPPAIQAGLTGGTLVVECVLPFLLPWARARPWIFVVWTSLQLGILATANYGSFNWLSLALLLSLLAPAVGRSPWSVRVLAAVIVPLSLVVFANRFGPDRPFDGVARVAQRFRVTNAYHLFASIDPLRDEVEIVGSDDARTWTPLPIAFKPGEPMSWLAPYHPRVAFQLWFYPLGGRGTPAGLRVAAPSYVARLVQRWCTDPDVLLPILTRPVAAPRYVSIRFWRATFTAGAVGWDREELGRHPEVYPCASGAVPLFPQVDALVR